ncbi:MAG: hypothetical protein ACRD6N_06805, partial [Pyrinomonadaceae bacterium]
FNKEVVAQVTSIILHKGDDVYCPSILALLTNPHTEINKNLLDLFTSDIALLKTAYFFILVRAVYASFRILRQSIMHLRGAQNRQPIMQIRGGEDNPSSKSYATH